jgi:6-phosphogluconolactonase/glucosamine-6-phosphate isomerase/deaminase
MRKNNNMEIIRSAHPREDAAKALESLLTQYADQSVLLLVSGGSAFSFLDEVTAEGLSSSVTIAALDERFDERATVNNFAQLAATQFFATASACGCTYIDTRVVARESLADMAARYDDAIMLWQAEHPEGVVIATLGLGVDGHTAGNLPGTTALLETYTTNVAPLEVLAEVNEYTKRVTVTPYFLKTAIAAAVAYVVGEEKCSVLAEVLLGEGDVDDLPGLLWHEIPNLTVVTSCQP